MDSTLINSSEERSQRAEPYQDMLYIQLSLNLVLVVAKKNSWLFSLHLAMYFAFFSSMSFARGLLLFVIVLPKCLILLSQGVLLPLRIILGKFCLFSSHAIHLVLDLAGLGSVENFKP